MKSNTNRLILVLTLLFVGMVEVANAFYDPGLQRWINRDPMGDEIATAIREKGKRWMTEGQIQSFRARIQLSSFLAMGNDLIGSIDPFGLDPYDKFPDLDSAAKDAACYIRKNPYKIDGTQYERGSVLFRGADGKYYYNTPWHGKNSLPGTCDFDFKDKKKDEDTVEGTIHEHLKAEDFSCKENMPGGKAGDIEYYEEMKKPGYLVTPKGEIKKYDPATDKTTNVGSCNK
jgi:hypothetical protein